MKALIDISVNDIANLLAGKVVKYSTEKLIGETIEIEVKLNDEKSNIKTVFLKFKIKWLTVSVYMHVYFVRMLTSA